MRKPTIPEVRARFQRYHKDNPSWGSLHIVLDDGNVSDGNVAAAVETSAPYTHEVSEWEAVGVEAAPSVM